MANSILDSKSSSQVDAPIRYEEPVTKTFATAMLTGLGGYSKALQSMVYSTGTPTSNLNITEFLRSKPSLETAYKLLQTKKINHTQFIIVDQLIEIETFSKQLKSYQEKGILSQDFISMAFTNWDKITQSFENLEDIAAIDHDTVEAFSILNHYTQNQLQEKFLEQLIHSRDPEALFTQLFESMYLNSTGTNTSQSAHNPQSYMFTWMNNILRKTAESIIKRDSKDSSEAVSEHKAIAKKILDSGTDKLCELVRRITPQQLSKFVISTWVPKKLNLNAHIDNLRNLYIDIANLIDKEPELEYTIQPDLFKSTLLLWIPGDSPEAVALRDQLSDKIKYHIEKQRQMRDAVTPNGDITADASTDSIADPINQQKIKLKIIHDKIIAHKTEANIDDKPDDRLSQLQQGFYNEIDKLNAEGKNSELTTNVLALLTQHTESIYKAETTATRTSTVLALLSGFAVLTGREDARRAIQLVEHQEIEEIASNNDKIRCALRIRNISARIIEELNIAPENKRYIENLISQAVAITRSQTKEEKIACIKNLAAELVRDSVFYAYRSYKTSAQKTAEQAAQEQPQPIAPKIKTTEKLRFLQDLLQQEQSELVYRLDLINDRASAIAARSVDLSTAISKGKGSSVAKYLFTSFGRYTNAPVLLAEQLKLLRKTDLRISEIKNILKDKPVSISDTTNVATIEAYTRLEVTLVKLEENRKSLYENINKENLTKFKNKLIKKLDKQLAKRQVIDELHSIDDYLSDKLSFSAIQERQNKHRLFKELLSLIDQNVINNRFIKLIDTLELNKYKEFSEDIRNIRKIYNFDLKTQGGYEFAFSKTADEKHFTLKARSAVLILLEYLTKATFVSYNVLTSIVTALKKAITGLFYLTTLPLRLPYNKIQQNIINKTRKSPEFKTIITEILSELDAAKNGTSSYANLNPSQKTFLIQQLQNLNNKAGIDKINFGPTLLAQKLQEIKQEAIRLAQLNTKATSETTASARPVITPVYQSTTIVKLPEISDVENIEQQVAYSAAVEKEINRHKEDKYGLFNHDDLLELSKDVRSILGQQTSNIVRTNKHIDSLMQDLYAHKKDDFKKVLVHALYPGHGLDLKENNSDIKELEDRLNNTKKLNTFYKLKQEKLTTILQKIKKLKSKIDSDLFDLETDSKQLELLKSEFSKTQKLSPEDLSFDEIKSALFDGGKDGFKRAAKEAATHGLGFTLTRAYDSASAATSAASDFAEIISADEEAKPRGWLSKLSKLGSYLPSYFASSSLTADTSIAPAVIGSLDSTTVPALSLSSIGDNGKGSAAPLSDRSDASITSVASTVALRAPGSPVSEHVITPRITPR